MAAMLLAAAPRASASAPVLGRLCAAHPLPLPLRQRDERRDCPDACHAACTRSARGEGEDENCD
ncbi:MAG: hypothetical protein MT490_14455 [Sphingomonas sp.]|uniref:hypothetical protein n=1 Tax=Sphingomonas sp. TaxID=28214 RepID=UPI002272A6DE|nr:hypothetical protein [Sphingomonas sp.]MCX8476990.1 hypothetical protein [Sphingomonas sp.]